MRHPSLSDCEVLRCGVCGVVTLVLATGLGFAPAAHADRPSVRVQPRTQPLLLDGRLDEAAWVGAGTSAGFVERKPALGAQPRDATRFALLVDRAALWVGVWCDDGQPDGIRARTTARDTFALFADDAISVKIDATQDKRTTHGFALNPAGARLDYRGVDEAEMKIEADAVWQGAAARSGRGWTAEFRIPWGSLGLDPQRLPDQIGLNFSRDHSRRNATYDWALMPPPYSPIAASLYGRAWGLAVAATEAAETSAAGADLAAQATQSQQAAAALREQASVVVPYLLAGVDHAAGAVSSRWNLGVDWNGPLWERARGQATVNTDFAQVDLDNRVVNLTRFSLFMPEKRDFFNKDVDLYAVGRPQALQLFYSRTIGLSNTAAVPILAGLKVAGQAGEQLRYGALEVATGTPRNPQAVMGAMRGVVDLGSGSKVGTMFTHRVGDGPTNLAGGFDATLRAADSRLLGEAYALASSDDGNAAAAGGVDLQWRGLLVRPKLNYHFAQDSFRPALGFAQRTGMHDGAVSLTVEPRIGDWGLEKLNCSTKLRGVAGMSAGRLLDRSWGCDCTLIWNSGWTLNASGERASITALEPFTFGRNVAVAAGQYESSGGGVEFSSPGVDDVVVGFGVGTGELFGGTDTGAGGSLTLLAGQRLRLELSGEWHRIDMPNPADDFDSLVVNGRVAVGLSPDLNLDGYGGYNHVARQLIAQLRLRWTWTQASDLFVVWQETLATAPWSVTATSVVAKATWAVF